jgi:hypothetical protein
MCLDQNPSGLLAFQRRPRPDPIVGSRIAALLLTGKAPFADHGQSQIELNVFPKPKKRAKEGQESHALKEPLDLETATWDLDKTTLNEFRCSMTRG